MLDRNYTERAPVQHASKPFFSPASLPILAVGAILLAVGFYGAWRVHRLYKRGSEMLSDNVASIRVAEELATTAHEIRYRLKRYLSSRNERHLTEIHELTTAAEASAEKTAALAKTTMEVMLVDEMRQGLTALREDFRRASQERDEQERRTILHSLADVTVPDSIIAATRSYIGRNEKALDRSNRRNQSNANRLMFGLLLLGVCGGVAGLIAGYGVAQLVNRTIVQLTVPLRDTAGKLSQVAGPVAVGAEPGFGDLQSVLKSVSDHMTTVVERLQDSERDRLRAEQLAALGQMAAGLAHELRNPLTSMKAILQLAPDPADLSSRDLDIMREEIERLEHTSQSLLDFARPPQPRKSPTDLALLLRQIVGLARRQAEQRGQTIVCHTPSPANVSLRVDAGQLRQVVLNLLLNAIEATPRGGTVSAELEVIGAAAASRGGMSPSHVATGDGARSPQESYATDGTRAPTIVIRICDTGPGLPAELGDSIFQPFVTTKKAGTGLGLSICRQLVQAHDGRLEARNRKDGRGAYFEVRLPGAVTTTRPAAAARAEAHDAQDRNGGAHTGLPVGS